LLRRRKSATARVEWLNGAFSPQVTALDAHQILGVSPGCC